MRLGEIFKFQWREYQWFCLITYVSTLKEYRIIKKVSFFKHDDNNRMSSFRPRRGVKQKTRCCLSSGRGKITLAHSQWDGCIKIQRAIFSVTPNQMPIFETKLPKPLRNSRFLIEIRKVGFFQNFVELIFFFSRNSKHFAPVILSKFCRWIDFVFFSRNSKNFAPVRFLKSLSSWFFCFSRN